MNARINVCSTCCNNNYYTIDPLGLHGQPHWSCALSYAKSLTNIELGVLFCSDHHLCPSSGLQGHTRTCVTPLARVEIWACHRQQKRCRAPTTAVGRTAPSGAEGACRCVLTVPSIHCDFRFRSKLTDSNICGEQWTLLVLALPVLCHGPVP